MFCYTTVTKSMVWWSQKSMPHALFKDWPKFAYCLMSKINSYLRKQFNEGCGHPYLLWKVEMMLAASFFATQAKPWTQCGVTVATELCQVSKSHKSMPVCFTWLVIAGGLMILQQQLLIFCVTTAQSFSKPSNLIIGSIYFNNCRNNTILQFHSAYVHFCMIYKLWSSDAVYYSTYMHQNYWNAKTW